MGYTETNRQPNVNTTKRIKTAKEKLERALKELKDTRVPKELKDPKVAHGTAVKEAGEHTKTDLRKAKATGTTATEATAVEEEPTEAREEGGSSEKRERDQQHESGSPYVPKKKMLCKVCEWAEREWHIVTNHDRDTCNHPGGDMEGYSRFQCIQAQRQLNEKYYEEDKRNRQPSPRTSRSEPDVKRLKAAPDNNHEQDKSPERSANGERMLTNDEVVQRYFSVQMAKITIDGDDEAYEARVKSRRTWMRRNQMRNPSTTSPM